jgi:hypothetical protein
MEGQKGGGKGGGMQEGTMHGWNDERKEGS